MPEQITMPMDDYQRVFDERVRAMRENDYKRSMIRILARDLVACDTVHGFRSIAECIAWAESEADHA